MTDLDAEARSRAARERAHLLDRLHSMNDSLERLQVPHLVELRVAREMPLANLRETVHATSDHLVATARKLAGLV